MFSDESIFLIAVVILILGLVLFFLFMINNVAFHVHVLVSNRPKLCHCYNYPFTNWSIVSMSRVPHLY